MLSFRQRIYRCSATLQAIILLFASLTWWTCNPSLANATNGDAVQFQEDGPLSRDISLPTYHWWRPGVAPKAVVMAIHGLTMHGKSFDALGRRLATLGFDVYAADMRGYGRTLTSDHQFCPSDNDCRQKINYDRSAEDLCLMAESLRKRYPDVKLFAVGESLGAALIIRLAAEHSELVDGLVLSSPAIKRHTFIDPCLIGNGALMMANPRAQLDLMPFVRKYASDDPRVICEMESDPLLRRHLNAIELMQSSSEVRKTMGFVPHIPAKIPVLIIQGGGDRCIKANAVVLLLDRLRSNDQTVKWFDQRGHILLETTYIKPDTLNAVASWLDAHTPSLNAQSAPMMMSGEKSDPDAQGSIESRLVGLR